MNIPMMFNLGGNYKIPALLKQNDQKSPIKCTVQWNTLAIKIDIIARGESTEQTVLRVEHMSKNLEFND